jgi:thioredoxin reductase
LNVLLITGDLCYSAVSHAPLFIDREVVVIGDSLLALRSTDELACIARKVVLVAPTHGQLDSSIGEKVLQSENVEVLEGYRVEAVAGDEYARFITISKDDVKRDLDASAFFVELELIPQSEMVANLVKRDELGHIEVDCSNRTSTEGIFAAGDVANVISEQVLIAIGEGAKAAPTAYEYPLHLPE